MKKVLLFLIIVLSFNTGNSATIKQLLNSENLAIIEIEESEKNANATDYIASNEKKQCFLKEISTNNNLITVSTEKCEDKSFLTIGMKVEKSLFNNTLLKESKLDSLPTKETQMETKTTENHNSYHSFIFGLMLNPRVKIDGTAKSGSTSENGYFEYRFNETFFIGYEYSQFLKNYWNNGLSLEYSNLKFSDATVYGNQSGSSTVSLSGGMTIISILYQGKYLWNQFYLPVSAGLVSNTIDSTGSFTKTIKTNFLFGFGIGFFINDKFNIELKSSATSVYSDAITISGTTFTPNTGFFTSTQIALKVLFF